MAWRGLEVLGLLAKGPKSTRDIADALGVSYDAARDNCQRLTSRGLLRSRQCVHSITKSGRTAVAGGQEIVSGPGKGGCVERYKGSLRAKAWRAFRIRRKLSMDDLLRLVLPSEATPGDEANARQNLIHYLGTLTRVGFLLVMPKRGGTMRWLLARDTGPCAPAWNKVERTVTDANTGEVHALPKAGSKAAASHD